MARSNTTPKSSTSKKTKPQFPARPPTRATSGRTADPLTTIETHPPANSTPALDTSPFPDLTDVALTVSTTESGSHTVRKSELIEGAPTNSQRTRPQEIDLSI